MRTKLEKEELTTVQQRLERLAGIRQTRSWDCLLLVVRQPANATSSVLWPKSLEYVLGGGKPPASERRRP